jgi:hypothetical protein
MNREQRRKAAKIPMDAKTLKRIVDDAVAETKNASLRVFMLTLAKDYRDNGVEPKEAVGFLKAMEDSIDNLIKDDKERAEILKWIQSARADEEEGD